jgi:hypothetical protein
VRAIAFALAIAGNTCLLYAGWRMGTHADLIGTTGLVLLSGFLQSAEFSARLEAR